MEGVIAAVPTPVGQDRKPIRALFLEHCDWALKNCCDGLNILGSTGEATSFDGDARRQVMGWAAESFPRDRLMVGTGTPSLAETIALTVQADDLGYPVALVLPPYYYTPPSEQGLFDWYAALHEALGKRAIRVWFYNFPQMTGFAIPDAVIARLHSHAPERFDGIKDSSGDLDYCRRIVSAMPAMCVFPSAETSLVHARKDGFAGCISATVNQTAPLCARIWSGDPAPAERVAALRKAISSMPLIPAVKHLVARRTGAAEWANVLPPFTRLNPEQADVLDRLLPEPAAV